MGHDDHGGQMTGLCAVFLGAIALFVGLPSVTPAGAQTTDKPASITVAIDDNYPPFIFRDDLGQLSGQLKDTWTLWSRKTGIAVHLDAGDWNSAQRAMAEGRAQVIDTVFKTPSRLDWLDFSAPYATIDVAVFHQRDIGGIVDAQTLRGFTVGVKNADACIDWLSNHEITSIERYPSYESLIDAAARKEVLVFCMDKPPAHYLLSKKNLLEEFRQTETLYTGEFHWAVHKGDDALRRIIQAGFDSFSADERQELTRRWQGYQIPETRWIVAVDLLVRTLIVIVAVGIAMVAWNWALRRQVQRKTRSLTEALAALSASEERFRAIYDNVNDAIFLHELPSGHIVSVNHRMREMYGLGDDDLAGVDVGTLSQGSVPYDRPTAIAWLKRTATEGPQVFEWMARRTDGDLFWVEVSTRIAHIGDADYLLVAARDISERKAAQSHLEYLAVHDPLTQLPNSRLIEDMLSRAVDRAEATDSRVALLFLDLDQFKTINDTLGHPIGDRFLCEIASRLVTSLQRMGTVGRQGGDEFIVFLPDADEGTIKAVIRRLNEAVARPVEIDGHELAVTLSTGIAICPDDGRDFQTLLKKADAAMYHAKTAGRSTYRFFTESMNSQFAAHVSIAGGLRRALERGEFALFYQPQVSVVDGSLVGFEALIRWNHPQRGLLPPAEFISIAEEAGLIVPIGAWVIREACRQGALWQREGRQLRVAVNLSALQFRGGGLEQAVREALLQTGLDPSLLELELTETVLLNINDDVLATIRRLRLLGVHLSIDDFGTGYSSLAYIKRLAVTRLKIDRSFICDIESDPEAAIIAGTIVRMAHSLGLTTVAEGVETEAVLTILREWGCDLAQGYLFGKPVPVGALGSLLAPA